MTVEQLKKMPKIDAHVHFRGLQESEETTLIAKLQEHNMRWFTISTRGINRQFLLAMILSLAAMGARMLWVGVTGPTVAPAEAGHGRR